MTEKPYRVICVTPSLIQLEVTNIDEFAADESKQFKIGSYLKITDNNQVSVIAIIQSYKIKDPTERNDAQSPGGTRSFIVDAQPVGFLDSEKKFKRGGQQIAIPPTEVEVAGKDILELFYKREEKVAELVLGTMAIDKNIKVPVDGDRFFSKHIAVVGSTGSGKSCTVAKILQEGIKSGLNGKGAGVLNNSHIVVFDIHGEYAQAFPEANILGVEQLVLPYWLMNSEELEEMFIESNENNSHNQVSQFRHAVIENKKKHNSGRITYDTPVYFSLREVFNYIANMNNEVIGKQPGEGLPKLADANGENSSGSVLIHKREESYFQEVLKFVVPSTANATKASSGPFNGEFDRFIRRLETKLGDERLSFLLKPLKENGTEYRTTDIAQILKQLTGYPKANGEGKSNITIIDLAGIPFEETSIVVSLISRILFEFSFFFKKNQPSNTEVPILVVYEEAHKYVPNSSLTKFRSVRTSIERIAKEGRKYGISLMIVSQRPSEISETIFSQCNNFIAMRLTNPTDQNYVKRLLPDTVSNITENLPSLEKQEAIIIGDAITLPTLVCIDSIEKKPKSIDIDVLAEWQKDWYELDFTPIIQKLQKSEGA
jgi:ABC-type dipeptide/oligopeptide/nickel transport system ATPase component